MSCLNQPQNLAQRLLGLTLATVLLTSSFAISGYTQAISDSAVIAKTVGAHDSLDRPHTPTQSANGKIAFVSDRDGIEQIYVMNPNGGNQTRLTSSEGQNFDPVWSPDSTRIAFISRRDGAGEIYLMNQDGSNQTRLTINSGNLGYAPVWSPDSNRIAFENGNSEICVMNSDGSNLVKLTNAPNQDSEPVWSPDGSRIAFRSSSDGIAGLYVMNADGSNRRHLAANTFGFGHSWSPDASRIAFYSSDGICVIDADGSNLTHLTNGSAEFFFGPVWSPDGTRIALSHESCFDTFFGELCIDDIWTVNADGRSLTELATEGVAPVWSPDGSRIAFVVGDDIFAMNADGSGLTNISNTPEKQDYSVAWQSLPLAPPPCPNPIDCSEFFVHQHYLDFLNREPDAIGLFFWVHEIDSCGDEAQCVATKRVNVSAAYFLSIEFQQTGYLVYRIHKAGYGNLPGLPVPIKLNEFLADTQQVGQGVIVNQPGWEQVIESNKQTFTSGFVLRSPFTSAFPTSMTPTEFVDKLFANANTIPATAARADAINEFGSATTTSDVAARARALRRVAENSTLAQQEFNRAFVLMQYFGYLRRNPDDPPEVTLDFQGYNFWLNKLNSFNGDYVGAEMVKSFIVSGEYRQRFGP